ncbi:MAG: hypothetical protein HY716_14465 [Planctomycetes bacterium]|nr:hypothetical protein [Planctomycetota bacterium]
MVQDNLEGARVYRSRLYQVIFSFATLYHLGFGLWVICWPQSFFQLFSMDPPRYLALWQGVGLGSGLLGLVYGYCTFRLDIAKPLIGIGLAGKLLAAAGWSMAVGRGEWPMRTFTLVVFSDILWLLPFSLFLLEGTRLGGRVRASAPHVCAILNALAAGVLLLALRQGTEAAPHPMERAAYIQEHPNLWRGGWALWIAAASSLLAFYAWWGARLASPKWGVGAFLIAAAGLACDVFAESLYIGWLPEHLDSVGPVGTLLTGAAANGLYTLAGILLTLGTKSLKGWRWVWTWIVWTSGMSLTLSTLFGSVAGMVASTVILMTSFPSWVWIVGPRLR